MPIIIDRILGKKFRGALDGFPLPSFAVSSRKLLSSYSGFCWRITRASDNASTDIGFNSKGVVDQNAINAFAQGGAYTVRTAYNQNTSFSNLIQTTIGSQPTVNTANSNLPSLVFDGVNDNLPASDTYGISNANGTFFILVDTPTNSKGAFLKIGGSSNGIGIGVGETTMDGNGNNLIVLFEAVAWYPSTQAIQGKNLITVRVNSGSVSVWNNKVRQNINTGNMTAPTANAFLGGYSLTNRYSSAKIFASIAYGTSLSDAIISNIQDSLLKL